MTLNFLPLSRVFKHQLLLTFDTEDFISDNSVLSLNAILESLGRYGLKAWFFLTGHMAEKLQDFPNTVDIMNEHEIGYHSSGHSVHPNIPEFTDVDEYRNAYEISLQRETAHINPLTGEVEGRGGIRALQDLFPKKKITSFRAPGCCWSPPHLEALKSLGIQFDFSADFSDSPVTFKGLTFYPYAILGNWAGKFSDYRILWTLLLRQRVVVLGLHPSLLVNQSEWDTIYYGHNPKRLTQPSPKTPREVESMFRRFNLFLKQVEALQKAGLIDVTTNVKKSTRKLRIVKSDIEKAYKKSVRWAIMMQNCEPQFMRHHFFRFFESATESGCNQSDR